MAQRSLQTAGSDRAGGGGGGGGAGGKKRGGALRAAALALMGQSSSSGFKAARKKREGSQADAFELCALLLREHSDEEGAPAPVDLGALLPDPEVTQR